MPFLHQLMREEYAQRPRKFVHREVDTKEAEVIRTWKCRSIFHAQTPPAAPVLMPVHLPEMLHAMNLSDIVTPITPLPTPLVATNDNHYFAARKFNDLD